MTSRNAIIVCALILAAAGCAVTQEPGEDDLPGGIFVPRALVDDHNRSIEAFLKRPTDVRISCAWLVRSDGQITRRTKEVVVTAPDELRRLFRNLKIEDRSTGFTMHGCAGHIKFHFQMKGKAHEISFDHGTGILSTLMIGAGFRDLPNDSREGLIRLLMTYGFTARDIGISE